MSKDPCVTEHTAFVYDRGGMSMMFPVENISRVRYTRDRDGVSEAEILVSGSHCWDLRQQIVDISTKRHELVIYRGQERVWEGPLFRISDEGPKIILAAKDVLAYPLYTALSQTWDNSYHDGVDHSTTVTARVAQILEYEMTHSRTVRKVGGGTLVRKGWEELDPPANVVPHLVVHHFPNEARTSAKNLPSSTTVGNLLQANARTNGIDFTAVGRAIHIWDTSRSIGRIRTLTEEDFFGPLIVTEYGADHTQIAYVAGMDGVYGEAANPENLDYYGPWETVYTAYNEEGSAGPNQVELNSQASRNTSGRSPVPFEVRVPDNSSIRIGETLSVNDLIPGVQVPLRATINARNYEQLQKIDHVVITEAAEGETVQVTLTPATKPDDDIEQEE